MAAMGSFSNGSKVGNRLLKLRKAARSLLISRNFCESSSIISKKIDVNGVNLHYEVSGNSQHVILCIPGALGSTRSDFGPQINGLSGKFTVVAFDPRGYGASIPPQRDFPKTFFQRDADDAAELMLKLGFEKFSVLGWSDGGIAGMILSGERPELVRKLVVWGANAFVSQEDVDLIDKVRDLSKWSAKMREPLERMYGKENLQGLWSSWIDAYFSFKDDDNGICKDSLPKINCPTLVIHGSKDPMVQGFHPEYIHKNIRNSKIEYFPEGKHNLHLRYHDEFNSIVTKFLNE